MFLINDTINLYSHSWPFVLLKNLHISNLFYCELCYKLKVLQAWYISYLFKKEFGRQIVKYVSYIKRQREYCFTCSMCQISKKPNLWNWSPLSFVSVYLCCLLSFMLASTWGEALEGSGGIMQYVFDRTVNIYPIMYLMAFVF